MVFTQFGTEEIGIQSKKIKTYMFLSDLLRFRQSLYTIKSTRVYYINVFYIYLKCSAWWFGFLRLSLRRDLFTSAKRKELVGSLRIITYFIHMESSYHMHH